MEIKSTSEYFENTPEGRFMENIIANVAQFDNDVRTERCIGGMKDAAREGRYVWVAPVGYSNSKVGVKANIVQNEMASLVRAAFEEAAKGMHPIEQVRKMMTTQGLTVTNGRPLARSCFYRMLNNELYCGWIVKFSERHRGTFEPIISEALFQQVQLVLKRRKRPNIQYRIENPDFPLRRFIIHPSETKLTAVGEADGRKNMSITVF